MGRRQTIPGFHGNEALRALGRQVWRIRLGRKDVLRLPQLDFFDLQYKEKPSSFRFPPHRHTATFEIYYVDRGRVRFSLAGGPFRSLKHQQLLLIPPRLVHGIKGDDRVPASVITLHFNSRDLLRRLPRLQPWLGRAIPHNAALFADLDRLCAVARLNSPERGPRVSAALFNLLLRLTEPPSASSQSPATQSNGFVGRVETYIRDHLQDPLTLNRLATALGCSVSNLTHEYRRLSGRTPTAFLLRCRVDHAKELLRRPGLALKAIAPLSGFTSQSAFGRSFLRREGLTPGDYRRTLAAAQPVAARPRSAGHDGRKRTFVESAV